MCDEYMHWKFEMYHMVYDLVCKVIDTSQHQALSSLVVLSAKSMRPREPEILCS